MTETTFIDQASTLIATVRKLEAKSDADDNTIALLKKQNAAQAEELSGFKEHHKQILSMLEEEHEAKAEKHDDEMRRLTQERDVAIQHAAEVKGIITSIGTMALEGVRRMVGDATPAVPPPKPVQAKDDARLPDLDLDPPPAFLSRPRDLDHPVNKGRGDG